MCLLNGVTMLKRYVPARKRHDRENDEFHSSDGGRGGKSGSPSIMPVSRYSPGFEIMEPMSA